MLEKVCAAFNKAIDGYDQLMSDIGFSPLKDKTPYSSGAEATTTNHESSGKVFITSKTRSTITSSPITAAMTFSAIVKTPPCPIISTCNGASRHTLPNPNVLIIRACTTESHLIRQSWVVMHPKDLQRILLELVNDRIKGNGNKQVMLMRSRHLHTYHH
jgi:hypothetical protein